MSDLDGLIARIRALEAERAVLATLYRYGHTIGVGDEDGWLDCFAPDGVFDVRRRVVASPCGRVIGLDAGEARIVGCGLDGQHECQSDCKRSHEWVGAMAVPRGEISSPEWSRWKLNSTCTGRRPRSSRGGRF